MILDTSALCGVLFEEPEAADFRESLASSERKLMSAVTALEVAIVVESRRGTEGLRLLNELLQTVEVAQEAWRRFGKGRHAAGLNFAECAAYALAKVSNQPLLFKGDDFSQTDIVSALRRS